jgi:hypothetical protein
LVKQSPTQAIIGELQNDIQTLPDPFIHIIGLRGRIARV